MHKTSTKYICVDKLDINKACKCEFYENSIETVNICDIREVINNNGDSMTTKILKKDSMRSIIGFMAKKLINMNNQHGSFQIKCIENNYMIEYGNNITLYVKISTVKSYVISDTDDKKLREATTFPDPSDFKHIQSRKFITINENIKSKVDKQANS